MWKVKTWLRRRSKYTFEKKDWERMKWKKKWENCRNLQLVAMTKTIVTNEKNKLTWHNQPYIQFVIFWMVTKIHRSLPWQSTRYVNHYHHVSLVLFIPIYQTSILRLWPAEWVKTTTATPNYSGRIPAHIWQECKNITFSVKGI